LLDFQNNQYARQLQDEIRLHFQSGKAIAKDWLSTAKRWLDGLGGIAGSITWGVIMLNFINTAFTYSDLTRDGDFSAKDIGKVAYGLGYSFNLLMAVFVEAPWAVISTAKPLSIGGYDIGILDKSATYWKARGNAVWGDAIRGFRGSMVAMGAFGIAAAALEAIDISNDLSKLKTSAEKNATVIKGLAVAAMGLASFAQLLTGISLASRLTTVVMSPWFSLALLIAGTIYLLATMVLNYFKQDSVGWWLRKCCWSKTSEHRHANIVQGQNDEIRDLLKIQLSPKIYVKSTVHYENRYLGKGDYISVAVQDGVGIQVLLPGTLRGLSVRVNVISSKRPWGVLPVEKIDRSIQEDFLDRGNFRNVKQFGTLTNKPAGKAYEVFTYPLMPPQNEDVVWETWVPLDKDASYLELQVCYPPHLLSYGQSDMDYLFQLELDSKGSTSFDGLAEAELEVKSSSRAGVLTLEIGN
ncbi:putative Membrane protein, partial [Pseudomonas caricapapayae]